MKIIIKNLPKKIAFTPNYYTFGRIKRDDKQLLGGKIWKNERDGRTFIYIPVTNSVIKEYFEQKYFLVRVNDKDIKDIKEAVYGIEKTTE